MKISVESDYAIRIVIYMYKKYDIVAGLEIVKACKVPERMGLKILSKLVANGILKSLKGKNGGYFFSKDKVTISLFEIVTLFDHLSINKCLTNTKNCTYNSGSCNICEAFKQINDNLIKNFSKILIADLL